MAKLFHRKEVLSLFSKCMREAKNWPFFEERGTRNWRFTLIQDVRTRFKENKEIEDLSVIRKLMEEGRQELLSLQNMKNNKYFDKVFFLFFFII